MTELAKKKNFRTKVMYLKQKKKNQKKNQKKESQNERAKKFIEYIEKKSKSINYELFKKHFHFVVPSALVKQLYETKNKKKSLS